MIKNERQYRITKAQAEKFENTLAQLAETTEDRKHIHPLLRKAEEDALRSQIAELRAEIEEYEVLKSGRYSTFKIETFEELPRVLIKARIASGLSQRDLAERLGLKEQQIQRYEDTDYASASFERLNEVIKALDIQVQEQIVLHPPKASMSTLFRRLKEIGLDKDFVMQRLIPKSLIANLQEQEVTEGTGTLVLQASAMIERAFHWESGMLFSSTPLPLNMATVGMTRFKKDTRSDLQHVSAYTIYAHNLAQLVLKATADLPQKPIPTEPDVVREEILSTYGTLTFEHLLQYVWSLGIPVLPLNDKGIFHGACWRIDYRNIIVLKQQTPSDTRWLFDLLHELRHAGQDSDQAQFQVIEASEMSQERQQADEEKIASRFAGDVILNSRAEELAQMCVRATRGQSSHGRVELLKQVVPTIARQEHVPTAALANYMAFRLSLQKINWWGAATNLQEPSTGAWRITRDSLLRQAHFDVLEDVDRELLVQALSNPEV